MKPNVLPDPMMEDILAMLKQLSKSSKGRKIVGDLTQLPFLKKHNCRCFLNMLESCGRKTDFVGVVDRRGSVGKMRTVLLKDLHIFGISFVIEDHVWLKYDKLWERIEPFVQGQKIFMSGTAVQYKRGDGSIDFTIDVDNLKKL